MGLPAQNRAPNRVAPTSVWTPPQNQAGCRKTQARQSSMTPQAGYETLIHDGDGKVWSRTGFPLIRAGQVNVFAARDSCNVDVLRRAGNIFSDHLEFIVTCNPLKALALFTFEYVAIILIFAGLYFLGGDECVLDEAQGLGIYPMDYAQAYYLSLQTMTTVGYGAVAPLSTYCNLISLAHCWTCTIFIALITSILLLNITRPNVDVVFSENAVFCHMHTPTGMLRGRDPELHFQILKDSNYSVANIGITANLWDYSAWPRVKRQALVLGAPTLSWMEYGIHNVHVVDEKSPLRPIVNHIRESGTIPNSFNILVTMNCVQSATGSVLTRMYSYCHSNIQLNKRFKPLLVDMGDFIALRPVAESHELIVDLPPPRPTLKQVAKFILKQRRQQEFEQMEEERRRHA